MAYSDYIADAIAECETGMPPALEREEHCPTCGGLVRISGHRYIPHRYIPMEVRPDDPK